MITNILVSYIIVGLIFSTVSLIASHRKVFETFNDNELGHVLAVIAILVVYIVLSIVWPYGVYYNAKHS